jgi:hypothetical protein
VILRSPEHTPSVADTSLIRIPDTHTMIPKPNHRLGTLLRYTYQVNMVFFAGFATWYLLKGLDQKELSGYASTTKKRDRSLTKQ